MQAHPLESNVDRFNHDASRRTHTYDDGGCTDTFNSLTDKACELYLFQFSQRYGGQTCGGAGCPLRPLPTHNGTKVIQLCLVE